MSKLYTAEQYVNQFLIPKYNDLLEISQRIYSCDLERHLFHLCYLISYIQSKELWLSDRTLDDWALFTKDYLC